MSDDKEDDDDFEPAGCCARCGCVMHADDDAQLCDTCWQFDADDDDGGA